MFQAHFKLDIELVGLSNFPALFNSLQKFECIKKVETEKVCENFVIYQWIRETSNFDFMKVSLFARYLVKDEKIE